MLTLTLFLCSQIFCQPAQNEFDVNASKIALLLLSYLKSSSMYIHPSDSLAPPLFLSSYDLTLQLISPSSSPSSFPLQLQQPPSEQPLSSSSLNSTTPSPSLSSRGTLDFLGRRLCSVSTFNNFLSARSVEVGRGVRRRKGPRRRELTSSFSSYLPLPPSPIQTPKLTLTDLTLHPIFSRLFLLVRLVYLLPLANLSFESRLLIFVSVRDPFRAAKQRRQATTTPHNFKALADGILAVEMRV